VYSVQGSVSTEICLYLRHGVGSRRRRGAGLETHRSRRPSAAGSGLALAHRGLQLDPYAYAVPDHGSLLEAHPPHAVALPRSLLTLHLASCSPTWKLTRLAHARAYRGRHRALLALEQATIVVPCSMLERLPPPPAAVACSALTPCFRRHRRAQLGLGALLPAPARSAVALKCHALLLPLRRIG
jgi:hypothetical protein